MTETHDVVNHPKHYTSTGIQCEACGHPVEVISITELHNFCLGNTLKYILRAGIKDPAKVIEDLEKGAWYLNREINNLKKKYGKGKIS
jgi:hypothetical protein